MHFDSGLLALLFVIIALFIGALVRHLLKGSQVPYTVALLILGIAIGLAHRGNAFTDNYTLIGETLSLASEIDPHLFLFLFLPTLIFESDFGEGSAALSQNVYANGHSRRQGGFRSAARRWLTGEVVCVGEELDVGSGAGQSDVRFGDTHQCHRPGSRGCLAKRSVIEKTIGDAHRRRITR